MGRKRYRFNPHPQQAHEAPEVDDFLEEIIMVCKVHGLSLSHEDLHGAFVVTRYSESKADWLRDALDGRDADDA